MHEIWVPGRQELVQVSAIYDIPLLYEREATYFGAIVAPYANRISNAKFEIDGVVYFSSAEKHCIGDFVKVKIVKSSEYDLLGELAE